MKMIEELSKTLSWNIVHKSYFFHALYIVIWATAVRHIKRSVKIEAPGKSIRLLHRIFSFSQILEYRLLPKNILGTSIIACLSVSAIDRDDTVLCDTEPGSD